MTQKKGFLITFEGTEGAGKSSLIQALIHVLTQNQIPHIHTREPGGNPLSESIRKLIIDHSMNPWTELFLYEASRAEHLHQVLLPALKSGKVVLCDRFTDSSLAYQGYARGLPLKSIYKLNHEATQGLKPDLSVFLDIDPAKGLKSATDPNRFEREGVLFQTRVRKGFLSLIKKEPKRWIKLKAKSATPEEMAEALWQKISTHSKYKIKQYKNKRSSRK